MQYMDEVTMKALELQAPRVCTRDVNEVRGQVLGGTIFSEQDRAGIWARVQAVDDLIPSLDALFENLNYLKVLADCMTRLVRLLPGGIVSVLFKAFSDTNQRPDRAIIQVTESSFSSSNPKFSTLMLCGCCRHLAQGILGSLSRDRSLHYQLALGHWTTV